MFVHMVNSKVGSWNLNRRVGEAAVSEGKFLAEQGVEIVALQEVNANSIEDLCEAAGLDWYRSALELRPPGDHEGPGRRLAAAVAGRGAPPLSVQLIPGVPVPERTLAADFGDHIVCSFHAPPGVSWFIDKARQAVAIARWLADVDKPVWFGIDANTPWIDHPDFSETVTHWHTGSDDLDGEPGDDLLVGPDKIHDLEDAFRGYLRNNPEIAAGIAAENPEGPLAVSHRTGKRRDSAGNPQRYDAIWTSPEFEVGDVAYHYDSSIEAGSDHALVTAWLGLALAGT